MSHIEKIITERHPEVSISYQRHFQLIGDYEGNGYSFPCNKDGSLDTTDQFYEFWKDNFQLCLDHPEKYEDRGCVVEKQSYMEPAYVQCSCGEKLYLNKDIQCKCGQWYNRFGQALLPPKYWDDEY
jgi:hypothetical protein